METSGGIFARLIDKALTAIALIGVVAAGLALWQMGPAGRGALWQTIWSIGLWLILIAALPWSGWLLLRRLLTIESNWAGVAWVAALSGADAVLGVWIFGGWPAAAWHWVAALATLIVGGAYNYLVSEYLADELGG